jgi:hypothetical protein
MSASEYVWRLRVASASKESATVYARKTSVEVGAPLRFDEAYEGMTALETALGAIGADLACGLHAAARRRRLLLDRVEALVEGRLENALTHLGVVGEEGSPALERVAVRVFASSADSPEEVEAAWQETLARSPLYQTFHRCLDLDLDLRIVL